MGGECIDLMNECIFVGVLVANVQSGARSYFCGCNLTTKPLALSAGLQESQFTGWLAEMLFPPHRLALEEKSPRLHPQLLHL